MENYYPDDKVYHVKANYGHNTNAAGKVTLFDAEIYYETYGSGRPLLLLHGNSQSINAFKNQISDLSKKYTVIAVDSRGHGNSKDFSFGQLKYEKFAEDMVHLLDSLNLPKADVLGWSDGGIIGIIMALKHPAHIGKLAVMGANIFPKPGALKDIVFVYINELLTDIKYKRDAKSTEQKRLYELAINEPHLTFDELKNITCPTLVMAGENDLIFDSHTREMAKSIPGSQLRIFENSDHFAPYFAAVEFNKTVLRFLDGEK